MSDATGDQKYHAVTAEPGPGDVLTVTGWRACGPDDPRAEPAPESFPGAGGGEPLFARRVTARGWVSATTNHFGPECYDPAPPHHRRDDARPRKMTAAEWKAYHLSLLAAQDGGG